MAPLSWVASPPDWYSGKLSADYFACWKCYWCKYSPIRNIAEDYGSEIGMANVSVYAAFKKGFSVNNW